MDDYKKDNSSYEPNFVMKDPDPETVEHETSQESTTNEAFSSQTASQESTMNGTASQQSSRQPGSFRDPRDNFRKDSIDSDYNYTIQNRVTQPHGTIRTVWEKYTKRKEPINRLRR